MTIMRKILAGSAGIAALAAAAPASAQYAYPGYGYGYNVTAVAAQRCSAAVQQRLVTRTGLSGVIGSLLGAYAATPRVLSITQVVPRRTTVRIRGLATSGRPAYNPYGVYGAVGYSYRPDLSFKCDVDYRGFVRDVDINRR